MPLMYFIPRRGSQMLDQKTIERLGLAHALSADRVQTQGTVGPGGENGLLVARTGDFDRLRFDGEAQTWGKCDGGRFWVGRTDAPITPDDLLVDEPIGGHRVKLGDGREWLVPVARAVVSPPTLPMTLVLDEHGTLQARAMARYQWIVDDAQRVWQQFERESVGGESAGGEPLTTAETFDIAAKALSLNYRVGRWEISLLELLDTRSITKVLEALIDLPSIVEVSISMLASKKKGGASTPDGSATDSGATGTPLSTSPASQT